MLYSIDTGYLPADYVPHRDVYDPICTRLGQQALDEIDNQLAILVERQRHPNGDAIFCSSFLVEDKWEGTPLQAVYDLVGDEDLAGRIYGVMLWDYLSRLDYPEVYGFKRIEHLGEDQVIGLTYWLMSPPPPLPSRARSG